MPRTEVRRSPGYGEFHIVHCLDCGWESRPIDAVLELSVWNRAKNHRCDPDYFAYADGDDD